MIVGGQVEVLREYAFIIIDKRPVEEIRKNRTDGENIHRTIKRTADILN